MVTNKNSFRHLLSRKYPNTKVKTTQVYPIFILDAPLDEVDSRLYYNKALDDGLYWVTYIQDKDEAQRLLNAYLEGSISLINNTTKDRDTLPTSYTAFEQWLRRHNIEPSYKGFKQGGSRSVLLVSNEITNDIVWDTDHTAWMFYELNYKDGCTAEDNCTKKDCEHCYRNNLFNTRALSSVPYTIDKENNLLYVLMKASKSVYISKKKRILELPLKTLEEDF